MLLGIIFKIYFSAANNIGISSKDKFLLKRKKKNSQPFLEDRCSIGKLLRIEYVLLVDPIYISFQIVVQIYTSIFRETFGTPGMPIQSLLPP